MRSRIINLVFLLILLMPKYKAVSSLKKQNLVKNFLEKAILQLLYQGKLFFNEFSNDTALISRNYHLENVPVFKSAGQGRNNKKKLRRMNRTLLAIVMAYTLKFMFLIPSFVGTLILFKFTMALAGFFYALFAAVLGLDYRQY